MNTVDDIRTALKNRYPEVDDDDFALQRVGFVVENPMSAIGIVLISSLLLGTTDVAQLAQFTGYSRQFIRAIAWNMDNNRLWKDGKYECAGWSSGNLLPRNKREDDEFWVHILIAEGSQWSNDAKSDLCHDASGIFWEIKRVN